MMSNQVILSKDLFQLNAIPGGLRPGSISFKTVSVNGDRWVCVRDVQQDGQTSLAVVDLQSNTSERHNIREAEAAAMHPTKKLLALRSGMQLQMFDLNTNTRTKTATVTEAVAYWCWPNDRMLAIVTASQVLLWPAEGEAPPVKVFDRAPELDANVQILSYDVSSNGKWHMLNGVARDAAGQLVGKTQLYSVDNAASRVLDGHAGCLIEMPCKANDPRLGTVMALSWADATGGRALLMELPSPTKPDLTLERRQITLPGIQPGQTDFPVGAFISPKHNLLTVVTSRGTAILIDVLSGAIISQTQVTQQVIFSATLHRPTGGILCVNNQGSVILVSINDQVIARHCSQQLNDPELALRVASAAGLGGADDLFRQRFQQLVSAGDIDGAVAAALAAPSNSLRTADTLGRIGSMPPPPGGSPPMSTYFRKALELGPLNKIESVELARVVLQKGGTAYVQQQFDENKLEVSEELGDLVMPHDGDLALKVFFKAEAHHKVVNGFLQRNDAAKAVEYCNRVGYAPEWRLVLTNFVRVNPADSVALALMLHSDLPNSPVLDPLDVVEMYLPGNNIRQASEFLLKVLGNAASAPSTAGLQTKLLEINLKYSPQHVAQRIFQQNMCQHYDPKVIAPLAEKAGLHQYALEAFRAAQAASNYEMPAVGAFRRCLAHAAEMDPAWLLEFFGKLRQQDSLECIEELMANKQQNFKLVVQIATKYAEGLGTQALMDMFLNHKAFEVLYYFLGAVVPYSRDPEVHFRYIEAAAEVGQSAEVERMTRESPCYDGDRVKAYLKEKRLDDQWPFINVCDKHDNIAEMVKYLLDTDQVTFIEQYVQRRNPLKTPAVIGALMEYDASETLVKNVLNAAGAMCPIEDLVSEVEGRGRLRLLRPFLESRAAERSTDAGLHTALAKILVDANDKAEQFLQTNQYYDAQSVGQFCERRDPQLAFLAYSRGKCDADMVRVGFANGMWKPLARHLVSRHDLDLWASVLGTHTDEEVAALVEAVRHDALASPESADDVIVTVRAFMAAGRTAELTAILEPVVLHGQYQENKFLENLLLTAAIKARPEKVTEYLNQLKHYDPMEVAPLAIASEQFEAAFTVYTRANMHAEAVDVLLSNLCDLPRARAYAADHDNDAVKTALGKYLLQISELHDAIEFLIAAKNPDFVTEIVAAANAANEFGDLIRYLTMARGASKAKDPNIDTYLVLTFAKTGRLSELEEFLGGSSHSVRVVEVADKCYDDGLFDSARVLYMAASNYPKLASTLLRLQQYAQAVEAASKAQSVRTWKEVHIMCLAAGPEEAELATTCAVQIAAHPDELEGLVELYEQSGMVERCIGVLKSASNQPSAPMSLFTELGLLYAKYKPDKLLEHVQLYPKKINTHRMLRACSKFHHWHVARVLHCNNEDWLAAANVMMEHPTGVSGGKWDHDGFKGILLKLGAADTCYAALAFYVRYFPSQVSDLLSALARTVDPERVLSEVRRLGAPVALVQNFLESTQDRNSRKVNDALNALYLEADDFQALRKSVDQYSNFDSAELSTSLEKQELFEFRRIALLLHRRGKRFQHAITAAWENGLFGDAIDAAAESGDLVLVEKLLRDFGVSGRADCFAQALCQCYDFVPAAMATELAWRYKMTDAAVPFQCQTQQEMFDRITALETTLNEAKKQAAEARKQASPQAQQAPLMIQGGMQGNGF